MKQHEEERHADERCDDTDRHDDERRYDAGDEIAQHEEESPGDGGRRDERPRRGAGDGAHHVGHHQPHEADGADDAHGGPGGEGDERQDQGASAERVDADTDGVLLPERERVDQEPHEALPAMPARTGSTLILRWGQPRPSTEPRSHATISCTR